MSAFIQEIDFENLPAEKYWDYPKNYKGNKKEEIYNLIFSDCYYGAIKKDGHYFRFIKDENGAMRLQSRTESVNGGYLNKLDHVPHLFDFFNSMPNGTCLLGEIYYPDKPGSKRITSIMGCLTEKAIQRQQSKKYGPVHYWIFDMWAWNEQSMLDTPIEKRIEMLNFLRPQVERQDYVEIAEYWHGEELWKELQGARARGEEGIVMTREGTTPDPGKRTKLKTLKVKKELDNEVDCFIGRNYVPATKEYTGKDIDNWTYWINERTGEKLEGRYILDYKNGSPITPVTKNYFNNWAGAVELCCLKGNEEVHIGWVSGVTEEVKKKIVSDPDSLYHKVVKVNAMMIEKETKAFRHCSIVEWREDISWKDCTYEKIFGEE